MTSIQKETLDLIRATREALLLETDIYASREDCDYFRSIYSRPQAVEPIPLKTPPPAPKFQPLSPPVIIKATPVFTPPKEVYPSAQIPLESPRPPEQEDFSDLGKLFAKIAPALPLLWEVPGDAAARQHAQRWKTRNQAAKFSFLLFQEPEPQKELLKNLKEAVETVFGGARIVSAESIEKEKQWEAFLLSPDLRIAILCDYSLWQMPNLLQFYRELPTRAERFLLNTPLFLLPDLSLYLKDPLLKRSLWKALCQKIGA